MKRSIIEVVESGVTVYDLAQQYRVGMAQSPNHPKFLHSLPRRHGDHVRSDGGSAANDLIVTGTHVGTHIDALAHVSQDGKLYGGDDATSSCVSGRYEALGVHTIDPMFARGVLLDVAGHEAMAHLPGGYEVSREQLIATAEAQGTDIRPGDVVLVRSGWGALFDDTPVYNGQETGVPGIGAEAARWLASQQVHAVGADSTALEVVHPGAGHAQLPVHRIFLVDNGIYIIETMNLEALARDKVYEFAFVLSPLNIFGATGSPVRPLAVVGEA